MSSSSAIQEALALATVFNGRSTKDAISDILDEITGCSSANSSSSNAQLKSMGLIDDGVLVDYRAATPSLASPEWKEYEMERTITMIKLKAKNNQHKDKSQPLSRTASTELHTILKKIGSKSNGIVQSKQASITNVTWKEPIADTKFMPEKVASEECFESERPKKGTSKITGSKKGSPKQYKKSTSAYAGREGRVGHVDTTVKSLRKPPTPTSTTKEVPPGFSHTTNAEINQAKKKSLTLVNMKKLESPVKKVPKMAYTIADKKRDSLIQHTTIGSIIVKDNPFSKKTENSEKSLGNENPVKGSLLSSSHKNTLAPTPTSANIGRNNVQVKSVTTTPSSSTPNAGENSPFAPLRKSKGTDTRELQEGEGSSGKSEEVGLKGQKLEHQLDDNNNRKRATKTLAVPSKVLSPAARMTLLPPTWPTTSAYFPHNQQNGLLHPVEQKNNFTQIAEHVISQKSLKDLKDYGNEETSKQLRGTLISNTLKAGVNGHVADCAAGSSRTSPQSISQKFRDDKSSIMYGKEFDSLLARIKPPTLPDIDVCNVLPGTSGWQEYWKEFNTKMKDYYGQAETYSRKLDSLLVDEDGLSYKADLKMREIEEKALKLSMGLPEKPPLIREPLRETIEVGGYVIRPLGGTALAYLSTHGPNSFRLEVLAENIEEELENIHVDTKLNMMTITIPSPKKGNPFKKLIQITVPNYKKVQSLEVGHPLYNGGYIVVTGN